MEIVLNLGLALDLSVDALVGTTEAISIGDFAACFSLRQRFDELPVQFFLRVHEHVRKIMPKGFYRDSMTAGAVIQGIWPGIRARLPREPPSDQRKRHERAAIPYPTRSVPPTTQI